MNEKLSPIRKKITQLFEKIGERYEKRNLASVEVYQNDYVHVFCRLTKNPDKVIHIQGYPGDSNKKETKVWARAVDYNQMMIIRGAKEVSIGREYEATTELFPNFENNATIPYKTKVLEEMIKQNIPELSFRRNKLKLPL